METKKERKFTRVFKSKITTAAAAGASEPSEAGDFKQCNGGMEGD